MTSCSHAMLWGREAVPFVFLAEVIDERDLLPGKS
jgi:hypothetical protein